MKHCTRCAREYPDGSLFCTQCGLPLAEGGAAEAAVEEPPAAVVETTPDAAIVEAVPAAIEIPLSVPDGPSAPAAVAVAVVEEPPSPAGAAPPEPRGGESIGFFRKVGAFFLCVLLFLFLLIPAAVYEVRDASTEAWLSRFLDKLSVSDMVDVGGVEDAIADWLHALDPRLGAVELDLGDAAEEIDRFIDRTTIRSFAAEQAADWLDAVYSGASRTVLTAEDLSGLLAENGERINEQLNDMIKDLFGTRLEINIRLSRAERNALAEKLSGMLSDAGAYDYLDTGALKQTAPAAYYGLRFGFSYVTAGVSLLLAALMFIFLVRTLKSGLRAVNRAGIVLIVLGGLLTLSARFPKLFADLWLRLFGGVRVPARLAEEILDTHILVGLAILGAGALLTAATGLALRARKKRAAR